MFNLMRRIFLLSFLFCLLSSTCFGEPRTYPNEPDGFLSIKWGTDFSTLPPEKYTLINSKIKSGEKIDQYEKEKDNITVYTFTNGKLTHVTISIYTYKYYLTYRDMLFERYGRGEETIRVDSNGIETPNGIWWFGNMTSMHLSPFKDNYAFLYFSDSTYRIPSDNQISPKTEKIYKLVKQP